MVGSNGRERKGKQTVLKTNVPRSFTHTKVTNARKDRQGIQQEKFDQCVTCLDEGSYIFKAWIYIYTYLYGTAPLLNAISISQYKDFAGIRLCCIKNKTVQCRRLTVALRMPHADSFMDVWAEGAVPGRAQHQRAGPACPAVDHSHVPQAEQGQL